MTTRRHAYNRFGDEILITRPPCVHTHTRTRVGSVHINNTRTLCTHIAPRYRFFFLPGRRYKKNARVSRAYTRVKTEYFHSNTERKAGFGRRKKKPNPGKCSLIRAYVKRRRACAALSPEIRKSDKTTKVKLFSVEKRAHRPRSPPAPL